VTIAAVASVDRLLEPYVRATTVQEAEAALDHLGLRAEVPASLQDRALAPPLTA
jgi:hypothetical protein